MKVQGSVFDNDMRSISGVNVEVLGEKKYTTTNADGHFTIDAANANSQLRFSHAAYDYDTKSAGEFQLNSIIMLWPTELDGAIVQNDYKKKDSNTGLWLLAAAAAFGIWKMQPTTKKVKI